MLRYFKFEKIVKGDLMYDSSYSKEHCIIFDSSNIWTNDNIKDQIKTSPIITNVTLDTS